MLARPLILAALAATLALPALSEEKPANLAPTAAGSAGAVAQMDLAQRLYAVGLAQKDPLVVLAAARLAAGVALKETDRAKETTGTEPAEIAEGAEVPVDAAAMLASARELAGEDEVLAGLIDDAEVEGTRGRIGGATSTLSRLPPGMTDIWEVPFYGNAFAEIGVVGDGDANLDVLVTDENDNTICFDISGSDKVYCDFTPAWNGYFKVKVQNTGSARNSYYLMTN